MGGWQSLGPDRLIECERAAVEKIEGKIEDVGMWGRDESEVIGAVEFFETSQRKEDVSSLVSRI
jgi:hypothetical protein